MRYEDVDDITRQAACENVKKIVNAIKLLRIKYYPNFGSISEEDERTFQALSLDLERIASENDLQSLKNVLMSEVSAKYESKDEKEEGHPSTDDSILLKCYGAIDVQQQALSQGKIKQAIKCQKILAEYLGQIESDKYLDLITKYKREKFGELIRPKEVVQGEMQTWNEKLRGFCKTEYAEARNTVSGVISRLITKEQEKTNDNEELVVG